MFYSISAFAALVMLYVVIVSYFIRKVPGSVHPDAILILLTLPIGLYLFHVEKVTDSINLIQPSMLK